MPQRIGKSSKVSQPLDEVEVDDEHAIEAYKRIREGSLRGAHTTKAMIDFAKKNMPDLDKTAH